MKPDNRETQEIEAANMIEAQEDMEQQNIKEPQTKAVKSKGKAIVREIISNLTIIIIALGVGFFLNKYMIANAQVPTSSMEAASISCVSLLSGFIFIPPYVLKLENPHSIERCSIACKI